MKTSEIDRGFNFAQRLDALVREAGPEDLSDGERAALADYLITSAVQWVRRRNRIQKATCL